MPKLKAPKQIGKALMTVGVMVSPGEDASHLFTEERGFAKPIIMTRFTNHDLKPLDLIVFCGGSDVSPKMYGEAKLNGTHTDPGRDEFERAIHYMYYKSRKVGICRGAQFLCVLNGGRLWQDVSGHTYGTHNIRLLKDNTLSSVNTVHHQICRLTPEMQLLAYAEHTKCQYMHSSTEKLQVEDLMSQDEVEAFYIAHDRALGVQWHPEYTHGPSTDLFWDLFKEHLS